MKWIISQMDDLKVQMKSKDDKISELQGEIDRINFLLNESRQQENKLEKLLNHSKEVLFEGVQTLSKNVTKATEKGWTKVQSEILNNEKEFKIIEKMKEFANSLREELNNLLFDEKKRTLIHLNEETAVDEVTNNNSNVNQNEDDSNEDLTPEEREQIQQAKMESLQTFVLG